MKLIASNPPISTTNWKLETLTEHLDELRQVFLDNLPEDQKGEPNPPRDA